MNVILELGRLIFILIPCSLTWNVNNTIFIKCLLCWLLSNIYVKFQHVEGFSKYHLGTMKDFKTRIEYILKSVFWKSELSWCNIFFQKWNWHGIFKKKTFSTDPLHLPANHVTEETITFSGPHLSSLLSLKVYYFLFRNAFKQPPPFPSHFSEESRVGEETIASCWEEWKDYKKSTFSSLGPQMS